MHGLNTKTPEQADNRRDTGEVFYSINLDFPVGVTEMVAFPPKAKTDPGEDDR